MDLARTEMRGEYELAAEEFESVKRRNNETKAAPMVRILACLLSTGNILVVYWKERRYVSETVGIEALTTSSLNDSSRLQLPTVDRSRCVPEIESSKYTDCFSKPWTCPGFTRSTGKRPRQQILFRTFSMRRYISVVLGMHTKGGVWEDSESLSVLAG